MFAYSTRITFSIAWLLVSALVLFFLTVSSAHASVTSSSVPHETLENSVQHFIDNGLEGAQTSAVQSKLNQVETRLAELQIQLARYRDLHTELSGHPGVVVDPAIGGSAGSGLVVDPAPSGTMGIATEHAAVTPQTLPTGNPVLSGTATGEGAVLLSISRRGTPLYSSPAIPIVGGHWSHRMTNALPQGHYAVRLFNSDHVPLNEGSLDVGPTGTTLGGTAPLTYPTAPTMPPLSGDEIGGNGSALSLGFVLSQTTTDTTPTLRGTFVRSVPLMLVISRGGVKVHESPLFASVNGVWSYTVPQPLAVGAYTVKLYGKKGMVQGALTITAGTTTSSQTPAITISTARVNSDNTLQVSWQSAHAPTGATVRLSLVDTVAVPDRSPDVFDIAVGQAVSGSITRSLTGGLCILDVCGMQIRPSQYFVRAALVTNVQFNPQVSMFPTWNTVATGTSALFTIQNSAEIVDDPLPDITLQSEAGSVTWNSRNGSISGGASTTTSLRAVIYRVRSPANEFVYDSGLFSVSAGNWHKALNANLSNGEYQLALFDSRGRLVVLAPLYVVGT